METLICIECKEEIHDMMTNYGTPEYPCCIHCFDLAQQDSYQEFISKGIPQNNAHRGMINYLKGEYDT